MKEQDDSKRIIIVSDGTGKTAHRLMDAVLAQYEDQQVHFSLVTTYQQVRTKEQVNSIMKETGDEFLVIFSIISDDLRNYFHSRLEKRGILHLNILEPMLETMSKFLGVHPEYRPGLLQIIDDRYYRKIDAIGFTVEHDDGRGYRIEEAELILVGPSRSCKTPISMYISCNFGLKVANIPILATNHAESDLLARLANVNPKAVFGVLMQPEEMARIREERANLLCTDELARAELAKYHDIQEIRNELRFCRKLYRDHDWVTIDVTKRAIEEVADELLRKLHSIRDN